MLTEEGARALRQLFCRRRADKPHAFSSSSPSPLRAQGCIRVDLAISDTQRAVENKLGGKMLPKPAKDYSNDPPEHQALLFKVENTDFENEQSYLRFIADFRKSKEENEGGFKHLLHTLAGRCGRDFYQTNGHSLLELILSHKDKDVRNLIKEQKKTTHKDNPLHAAIERKNHEFLDIFISLAAQYDKVAEIAAALVQKDNRSYTCLHAAIQQQLPCVPAMIELCAKINKDIFSMKDSGQNTPLHLLMEQEPHSSLVYDLDGKIFTRPFNPVKVLEIMKTSLNTSMGPLWTKLNENGFSPYLKRRDLNSNPNDNERAYQAYLKDQIFQFGLEISEINKGLYGNGKGIYVAHVSIIFTSALVYYEGLTRCFLETEKELCLDMSDFNQSSHDFAMVVSEITKSSEKTLPFEESLIYVFLPDFNTIKKRIPHNGVRELFQWLSNEAHVKTIKSLNIPDSTTTPMSDELVSEAIIDRFIIEKFDWRKLDINLNILTRSEHKGKFTDLTLYSSGNWSVLYHWISQDGLQKLTGLRNVTIKIVEPNTSSEYLKVRERHEDLVSGYETKLEAAFKAMEIQSGGKFTGDVKPKQKWDFPTPRYSTNSENMKLEIIEKLKACHTFLESLEKKATTTDEFKQYSDRFTTLTEPPKLDDDVDRRIKVAIIDNGADKFRQYVKDVIEKGVSFVKVDSDSESRTLPWWMVSDPHGTQMASLVRDANPYCRLYIARVGRGRKDILPEDAIEAIKWAIEQKVDVISMSWIIKEPFPALMTAVKDAAKKALVICSTADEGAWSGEVYPADSQSTIKVAATDKYGNLSRYADKGAVNIAVPGEKIPAFGPSYMGRKLAVSKISGSSVATALAAGVASLALLLLQVFNDVDKEKLHAGEFFYTNEGMVKVLSRLNCSTNMSTLFPTDSNELPKVWNLARLEEELG
ncbi:hypothetical protein G7Y89_g5795 [Cudoniella acicularis]|uniref:Peptidase S8/S53 domain-containing protein n=1 Tax=Cudoniella acicularis TaxID=354080 RepID=A0A8H4RP47_9HELO|nr:hypothetical protein G7Y89_g5795 [Cudoniella acicularis]